jgi:oligopeptide/dipeptide ABC transporter ATP-binding protein
MAPLLEITHLVKHFPPAVGFFTAGQGTVHAVDDVSFAIEEGECFAIVGESGCGKTTTARLALLLEQPTAGSIKFRGEDVTTLRGRDLHAYRRSVQAVFQDPYSSLSPRMKVRDIIGEPLEIHERLRGKALDRRVDELLDQVGLPQNAADRRPHQFSGGQRQRVAIARALSLSPKLIVLDEPVSALDVAIRAQVLNLLSDLQERLKLSYLLISHDLAVVEHMSDQVAVMYAGKIVEMSQPGRLLTDTATHPYSLALLSATPKPDPDIPMPEMIGGDVADPVNPPTGCRFHPRCPLRLELGSPAICSTQVPPEVDLAGTGRTAACHFRGAPADATPQAALAAEPGR